MAHYLKIIAMPDVPRIRCLMPSLRRVLIIRFVLSVMVSFPTSGPSLNNRSRKGLRASFGSYKGKKVKR